jgi:Ataxin-3
MGEQGLDTPEYLKFTAEGSGNVARDGMFSIQVRVTLDARSELLKCRCDPINSLCAFHYSYMSFDYVLQVLQKALSNWDLTTTPLSHPKMQAFSMDPTKAAGYICNLSEHWFTIRPVHGQWWNLNSLLPAPQMVGLVYLHTYLETLRREKWTIYVVQGTLPIQADVSATYLNSGARLWTPEEVCTFMDAVS